ncbi:4Fe-4S ferredoxin iron-sulfur binding domain protein [Methanocaldococcus infernus ME]|uniref:Ferredoxin n=1 Tax=Methanocaldococcus infernus (strain DSM 11812 / JCM 15783 / ME) TaxID=573063 RepID=D5VUE0_METIM|nr:4Fe-4S dicluster domain-containing protein [Methanocaldococcus infernus]ADG12752.1 4Fe-4S ferredoxin iron-sulfur binding domain protein [Methanocaldococcus infernus ME]
MNTKIILVNPEKCSKCFDCITACEKVHGISRIKKIENIPIFCMQCEKAPCMEICPVDAIYLEEGIPIVNKEKCIGCAMCVIACPIGAIFVKDGVAHKCTLCLDAKEKIFPACVEACKDKAIMLVTEDEIEKIKEENLLKIIRVLKSKGCD